MVQSSIISQKQRKNNKHLPLFPPLFSWMQLKGEALHAFLTTAQDFIAHVSSSSCVHGNISKYDNGVNIVCKYVGAGCAPQGKHRSRPTLPQEMTRHPLHDSCASASWSHASAPPITSKDTPLSNLDVSSPLPWPAAGALPPVCVCPVTFPCMSALTQHAPLCCSALLPIN